MCGQWAGTKPALGPDAIHRSYCRTATAMSYACRRAIELDEQLGDFRRWEECLSFLGLVELYQAHYVEYLDITAHFK